MKNDWKKVIEILRHDGVAVMPTDTLYGVVASALSKKAVKRVYAVRGRDEHKPCIVLISSFAQLKAFGVVLTTDQKKFLDSVWPDKISVILPVTSKKWSYIHRDTQTIAFRMIGKRHKNVYETLEKVGPLIAPSANPQGLQPAQTIALAKKYFGNTVDIYIDNGKKVSLPSTLVQYLDNQLIVLREGAVQIKNTI